MDEQARSEPSPAIEESMHAVLDLPFQDAVDRVQLDHEIAGFETITVTRMENLVRGALEEEIERACFIIMCHAEVARDALATDRTVARVLPCPTAVTERPRDDDVHVHHISPPKAMRDLGAVPDKRDELDDLVALTGRYMTDVWEAIERMAVTDA